MNPRSVFPGQTYAPTLPGSPAIEFPRIALPKSRRAKRIFDLLFTSILGVVALPFAALIALAIRLESGGPVLFGHERVGRGNSRFRLWKFRTMVPDADAVLERHLEDNPQAAAEWNATHKLRRDPRITRVGRLLRRSSLDELPQVWNVLRGEMSLCGPRPVTESEVERYGSAWRLRSLALPGLTGLWQVSGRNQTTYRRRVELDSSYVRNWNVALDLRILLKTVRVVLLGKGAY